MRIEFQGAARTVTGSMHLLHIGDKRVLLDCGLFQGRREEANRRNREFPFDPKSIDAVVLSHAHIDHSGNLPGLVRQGYNGPIFCTPATRDLCQLMLADSAHIQEHDAAYLNKRLARDQHIPVEPLYTPRDAAAAMEHFRVVPYNTSFDVVPNLRASFVDAGHILGSASVHLTMRENGTTKTLGFTGDIGPHHLPIVRDPVFPGNVEYLISESTYGGTLHPPADTREVLFANDIRRVSGRGGKIIIPAFSVGRTQDIVFAFHKLFDRGELPRLPIYVDSPLAINATEIFKKHPECFDEETYRHVEQHHDPFGLATLHYVRSAEESKKLNDRNEPCVIIAASGMCEAGRVLHHLANNVEEARNAVMIVGFQAEHTLGRRLVERKGEVKILGSVYKLKAEVIVHNSFSAHADGNDLLTYIRQFDRKQLQEIFLVHGELARQEKLRSELLIEGTTAVEIPVRGQTFDV